MTAKSFFPDITEKEIADICRWEEGYVVWAFPFWLWMMDRGVKVTDYNRLDYPAWAHEGLDGLKKTVGQDSFEFISTWTKNLDAYTDEIRQVFAHPNFNHVARNPILEDLEKELVGNVCEATLDSKTLNHKEGFALHRIVMTGIDAEHVYFHDPVNAGDEPCPNRQEKRDHFNTAWQKGPELCVYRPA